jgi:hypothetical protein
MLYSPYCAQFRITPYCAQFHSSTQQPSAHLVVGIVSATTWFLDTDVNQHITPDLATLTDSTPYLGNDHLHIDNGKGLTISHIGHTKLHSSKCIFELPNCYYLFKNSFMIIMFILNFMLLYFMSRISSSRKFSFLVRVMMVSMFYLSLLLHQFLKCFGLFASPRLLSCGIVVWVILPLAF